MVRRCVTGIERECPAECWFRLGEPPLVDGKKQRAGGVRFRESSSIASARVTAVRMPASASSGGTYPKNPSGP
jgi:hypothetical protein